MLRYINCIPVNSCLFLLSCNQGQKPCIIFDSEEVFIKNRSITAHHCDGNVDTKWGWNDTSAVGPFVDLQPTQAGFLILSQEICEENCSSQDFEIPIHFVTICDLKIDSIIGIDTLITSNFQMNFTISDSIWAQSTARKYVGEFDLNYTPNEAEYSNELILDSTINLQIISEFTLHDANGSPYYKGQKTYSLNSFNLDANDNVRTLEFSNSEESVFVTIYFCLVNPDNPS